MRCCIHTGRLHPKLPWVLPSLGRKLPWASAVVDILIKKNLRLISFYFKSVHIKYIINIDKEIKEAWVGLETLKNYN